MGFVTGLLGLGGAGNNPNIPQFSNEDMGRTQGLAFQNVLDSQKLAQQLAAQPGIANQQNVFQQAQALSNQYGQIAQGQGPNPAQAMLNQATGQNIAQQAALMAGQRGAGANAGLIARQAAQQGAGIQQQAAGQAATLGAQQQLSALAAQGQQQQLTGYLAGQQVGQALHGQQLAGQTALGNQANVFNRASTIDQINADVNEKNRKNTQGVLSGLGQAVGGIGGMLLNEGGEVPNEGPCSSRVGNFLHKAMNMKSGGKVAGKAKVAGDSPKNDTVPAMLSPGEIVVPRSHAMDPEKAAAFARSVAMRSKKKGK